MQTQLDIYRDIMHSIVERAMKYRFIVAPNPTVGACLLYQNTIVAEGYHTQFGGKHAEIECLDNARATGVPIEQCTLLITLEPCSHYGKTPPCVEAILASGVQRVVIGTVDPHCVASGGIDLLRKHGIEVIVLDDTKAMYCIQDFTMWKTYSLPHIIVKLATSMDGYIATREYHSQWITNEKTRNYIHSIRAHLGKAHGGIIIGANTLRYDNPRLYANLGTDIPQPRPLIVSTTLDGLVDSFLLSQRARECIIITCKQAMNSPYWDILQSRGVSFIVAGEDTIDMQEALHNAYTMYDIWYLFCEGGSILAHSLLSLPIPMEVWHCVAPMLFADTQAIPMVQGASPRTVEQAYTFTLQTVQTFDSDIIAIYTK